MNELDMPKYKCHKEVWALKIKAIEADDDVSAEDESAESDVGYAITPEDQGYEKFAVSQEYMKKHNPKPGGYFVVYKDGYQSFSPADAFEEGYTRCD